MFLTRAAYVQGRPTHVCLYKLKESREIPKTKFRVPVTSDAIREGDQRPLRYYNIVFLELVGMHLIKQYIRQTTLKSWFQ